VSDCVRCVRPVADTGYACHRCAARLALDLLEAARLGREVAVTVARLDRLGERGGGRGHSAVPLAYAWEADEASWVVRNTLGAWARVVHEERGLQLPGRWVLVPLPEDVQGPLNQAWRPDRRPEAIMVWLAAQAGWLRMQPYADEAYDELHEAARLLQRTVDAPPALWYAGACWTEDDEGTRCVADLYAHTGTATVTCRQCGARHDADGRRDWLLEQARGTLAHAGLLATALAALGYEVRAATIRQWAHREHLEVRDHDERDRALYLVGDVIDLARKIVRTAELTMR
jgi:hypothetical protein